MKTINNLPKIMQMSSNMARDLATSRQPRNMENRLMPGDMVYFEDIKNRFIAVKMPHNNFFGCLAVVKRDGIEFLYRVSESDFDKVVNVFDGRNGEFTGNVLQPKGQPARDFRWSVDVFEGFNKFEGKVLKVAAIERVPSKVLKRGAVRDADGRFHESEFEIRERELITWEYVTA